VWISSASETERTVDASLTSTVHWTGAVIIIIIIIIIVNLITVVALSTLPPSLYREHSHHPLPIPFLPTSNHCSPCSVVLLHENENDDEMKLPMSKLTSTGRRHGTSGLPVSRRRPYVLPTSLCRLGSGSYGNIRIGRRFEATQTSACGTMVESLNVSLRTRTSPTKQRQVPKHLHYGITVCPKLKPQQKLRRETARRPVFFDNVLV